MFVYINNILITTLPQDFCQDRSLKNKNLYLRKLCFSDIFVEYQSCLILYLSPYIRFYDLQNKLQLVDITICCYSKIFSSIMLQTSPLTLIILLKSMKQSLLDSYLGLCKGPSFGATVKCWGLWSSFGSFGLVFGPSAQFLGL